MIPFDSTPIGSNTTHSNWKHQTTLTGSCTKSWMSLSTEPQSENGEGRTQERTTSCNQQDVYCTTEHTSFWVAKDRPVRPDTTSLESWTETDGDETMMKITVTSMQPLKPSKRMLHTKQAVTMRVVIGVGHVLAAHGGLTLTNDSEKNRKIFLGQTWTTSSSLTDVNKLLKVRARSPAEPLLRLECRP